MFASLSWDSKWSQVLGKWTRLRGWPFIGKTLLQTMIYNWLRRYYQWVNLVMFLQAACFYLPRCIYYAFVFLLILAISLFKFVSISSIFSLHTSLFSDYGLFISISKRFLWRRFENGILGHLQQELNNPLQLQVADKVYCPFSTLTWQPNIGIRNAKMSSFEKWFTTWASQRWITDDGKSKHLKGRSGPVLVTFFTEFLNRLLRTI